MYTPSEDPLERLLDEQSDEEFGEVSFREHLSPDQTALNLKSWTAKDFSEIYVRFYPHLLRHAKRFLTNHSQAEEVVQDAFLYLMTSLPEIDSEVGVLKLLKWKTRLLAIDVIRLNSRTKISPIDETLQLASEEAEVDQELIRADEAAIVAMALAKLPPRQREALIASVYEEKSTATVSQQLDLSENATRQLIFRAKSTFKRALIGEAETHGLSVSEILSIAARKARADAGKYASAASALLLVIAVSIGILPNLSPEADNILAAPVTAPSAIPPRIENSAPLQEAEEIDSGELVVEQETIAVAVEALTPVSESNNPRPEVELGDVRDEVVEAEKTQAPRLQVVLASTRISSPNSGFAIQPILDGGSRELLVFSEQGLTAKVNISIDTDGSYFLDTPSFVLDAGGTLLQVMPGNYAASTSIQQERTSLNLVANSLKVLNFAGIEFAEQPLLESVVTLTVELDRLGQPIQANLFFN